MKLFKQNILFILLFAIAVLSLAVRSQSFLIPIVSHPDSTIAFSTQNSVLEQTWQPHVKKIAGIKVPYVSEADFNCNVDLMIYTDDYSDLLMQTRIPAIFEKDEQGVLEFHFDTLKVVPGERYRFQLHIDNPSFEGIILIDSGSNYAGCSIDGQAYNKAAALEMICVKNSRIYWLFAVFFPFFAFSLLFMILWKRKWEECIGLSIIVTVMIMYIAGLFEVLTIGIVFVYILSVASLLISIYFYNRKGMTIKDLCSPAIAIYAILLVFILLNNRGAWFATWDEHFHWGVAAKDMFYYNSFAKHINTTVSLSRYPPFSTLIEYFFTYMNGVFTPELAYVAFQTTLISTLIIGCKVAKKRLVYLIPSTAIMLFVPNIFFGEMYNSIYVDPLLAAFAAYVLICYYSEDMSVFNILRILGGLFALTLTKDMGFVIACAMAVVMIADSLLRSICHKEMVLKKMLYPFLCLFFTLIVFFSWQIYMSIPAKAIVTNGQNIEIGTEQGIYFANSVQASGITFEGIMQMFQDEEGGYRLESIKNFIIMLFDEETFIFGNLGFSYIDLSVLILLLIAVFSFVGFWGNKKDKILSFGILTFLAGLGYCCVLELMYCFAFMEREAVSLASHGRYLGSFIGGVAIAFCYLLVQKASENDEKDSVSLTVIAVLSAGIIMCIPMESVIRKNMETQLPKEMVYWCHDTEEIFRSFSIKGEKCFFICNYTDGVPYAIFISTVCPVLSPDRVNDIYTSQESYNEQVDIWKQRNMNVKPIGTIMSEKTWREQLQDYQYVFILHPSDVFRKSYGDIFEEPDSIGDGTLYQVQQSVGEEIELVYIGKVAVQGY